MLLFDLYTYSDLLRTSNLKLIKDKLCTKKLIRIK